ncbi:MAG TPA: hypothetical protein VLZ75_01000 [Chitinophagales bacterium]|nr:hypothetical protein [Chitinophagales bacterium]
MTRVELKKHLIQKITEINDESFLNAIKTILDSKSNSQILKLTDAQSSDIAESKKEIKKGLYVEQAEMDIKFNEWLNAK